jgi:hypothetical protein
MSLFQKPKKEKRGIKLLCYGKTGVGKSRFALTFPRNAIIDTEDGTAFYTDNPNMALRLVTTSAVEIENAIDEIFEEHLEEIDTITIDSETKMYENLQHAGLEVAEKRARLNGRSEFAEGLSQKEWGKIKLIHKRINAKLIELSAKGKNIIVTAQLKDVKEKRGDDYVKVGEAPDSIKGLEFDFDIVLKMDYDKDGNRIGIVEKDRTNTYHSGDIIENPSYENWKHIFESSKLIKEESKINMTGDVSKDTLGFREPEDELEEIKNEIVAIAKEKIKNGKTRAEISKFFEEKIGTNNPLNIDDIEIARNLLEEIKVF